MINLKNPKVQSLLEVLLASFVGMIVALAWNSFIDSVLKPLQAKFAFLGILGYLLYAVVITIIAVFIISAYVHFIEKLNDNE